MVLLLFFLSVHNLGLSNSIDQELISNVLNQFKLYNFAFHYDNTLLDDVEDSLQYLRDINQPIYLINYDEINIITGLCQDWLLHIALLNNYHDLNKYELNLNRQSVIIIMSKTLLNQTQQKEICKKKYFYTTKAVFMVQLLTNTFSTCCYYCEEERVTLRTIPSLNDTVPDLKTFVNNFKNFGGYEFRIGYTDYPPFFYRRFDYSSLVAQEAFHGIESNVLNITSKLLNYKYSLIRYKGNISNSVKDIFIDEVKVRQNKLDWAISGISQTFKRTNTENVGYMRHLQFQSYMVVYEISEDYRLFSGQVVQFWYVSNWRSFLLTVAGVASIALVTRLSLELFKKPTGNFGEYAIMIVLYMVEQQSSKLKTNVKKWKPYIKILFTFWLFTCIYLLANYKSIQAYYLMTSQSGPNSIEDLVQKRYKIQIETDDYYNIKLHCQHLMSKLCFMLLKKLEMFEHNLCESIEDVLNSKVALMREEEPLKFTALRQCNLTAYQKQSLRFIPATVIPTEWHSWPFQKTAPYVDAFSRLISLIEANGLIPYWYTKETRVYNNYFNVKTQLRREKSPLDVSDFIYPFIVLLVGCSIAVAIFFKEIHEGKSQRQLKIAS